MGRGRRAPTQPGGPPTRRYLPDTAVIETRHTTAPGAVRVYDFMPLSDNDERADVVRIVRGESGRVEMRMELALRFNYVQGVPCVRRSVDRRVGTDCVSTCISRLASAT